MKLTSPPPGLRLRHPACWLATWFGAGLLPKAPGTWGSLAALPFGFLLDHFFGPWGLVAAATLLFPAGWWAAGRYARALGRDDPGAVVIDEVVGQWLVLAAAQGNLWLYPAAFALFRLADITKPWPVRWFDRKIKGGLGIMADDVAAAGYAAAALYLFHLALRG